MKLIKNRGAVAARSFSILAILSIFAAPAFADTGDTAWMLTSTALVLFMQEIEKGRKRARISA